MMIFELPTAFYLWFCRHTSYMMAFPIQLFLVLIDYSIYLFIFKRFWYEAIDKTSSTSDTPFELLIFIFLYIPYSQTNIHFLVSSDIYKSTYANNISKFVFVYELFRYPRIHVRDFHKSWRDGLAFNALIHSHAPSLVDYSALKPEDRICNLENAFSVAQKHIGVPRLLDPEGMCNNLLFNSCYICC